MHERTRLAVARLLFVFCCAVPTFTIASAVLVTFTPWYHNYRRTNWETALSQRLGVTVKIGRVEFPAPAMIRFRDVVLLQPETGANVATVHVADWVTIDGESAMRLSQPELQSAMLPFAWRVIHERFLCQPQWTSTPLRVAADDLTIHSRTGSMTMRDVDAWLRPVETGVEAMVQCVPADRTDLAAIHISAIRKRTGTQPSTHWFLNTGDIPLLCSTIADYLPGMRKFGSNATFAGTMRWQVADAGWTIDLGGARFDHVDLAELTAGMPHRLTGEAAIKLERCQIQPGRELDVSGTMISSAGQVSPSLMIAAKTELNFEINPDVDRGARDLPYELLAVRFDFFGADMTLEGICEKQRGYERLPVGMLIVGSGSGMLAGNANRQTWVGLARTLWPGRHASMPVSTQTAWLFDILPPPTLLIDHDQGYPLPPRITSADDFQGTPTIIQP